MKIYFFEIVRLNNGHVHFFWFFINIGRSHTSDTCVLFFIDLSAVVAYLPCRAISHRTVCRCIRRPIVLSQCTYTWVFSFNVRYNCVTVSPDIISYRGIRSTDKIRTYALTVAYDISVPCYTYNAHRSGYIIGFLSS